MQKKTLILLGIIATALILTGCIARLKSLQLENGYIAPADQPGTGETPCRPD